MMDVMMQRQVQETQRRFQMQQTLQQKQDAARNSEMVRSGQFVVIDIENPNFNNLPVERRCMCNCTTTQRWTIGCAEKNHWDKANPHGKAGERCWRACR